MNRGFRNRRTKSGSPNRPNSSGDAYVDSIDRSISKFMSLILRHQPEQFGLKLDGRGFVPIGELVEAIRTRKSWITESDIRRIAEKSEKQRFEIIGSMIRARYGHSVPISFDEDETTPPQLLYHGSSPQALDSIRSDGLKGMGRQYVHLSIEKDEARSVGLRHDPAPVVLTIKALEAHNQGYKFYKTGPLFMTRVVPPQFIIFPEEETTEL
ncbi:MAG: RNA 2'-phosphotransferase [Candidatus Glassbacteria bacterium]